LGDAISFTRPLGGLFVWAKLTGANGAPTDSAALAKRAIEQGVAFVPGAPFFANNPDPSSLRLSFATMSEDLIEAGVLKLKQALLG
jgi:2-aminoadipate transaminase